MEKLTSTRKDWIINIEFQDYIEEGKRAVQILTWSLANLNWREAVVKNSGAKSEKWISIV